MTTAARKSLSRHWIWVAVAAGILALLAANVHLVFVAVTSQPDCVAHAKTTGGEGNYMAAKSAC